ncbi:MAG TPA: TIR domain-containing protein [Mucilaginibacter sp.]|nr:TIR domain-containing protein [Mucilaginibacter sp.]
MSKTHNLFISHSWNYDNAYYGLIKLLDNRSYFFYKNYSVPKNDPILNAANRKMLYDAIKKQISYSHVVILFAGVYASYSEWINNEIIIAQNEFQFNKPILAVRPWGAQRTSRIVTDAADIVVNWNTESIISAIRELSVGS